VKPTSPLEASRLSAGELALGVGVLAVAAGAALLIGPADLPVSGVLGVLASKIPLLGIHAHLSPLDAAIVWQIRAPRVVLGGIVGATLALAGASYQGVFQNALADPYMLGVAAGAGLGATVAIVSIHNASALAFNPVPLFAFVGALIAVGGTYVLGRAGGRGRTTTSLILAGVALGSFLTALQTFVQQRSTPSLAAVYAWILGGLSTASWQQVGLVAPYVAVAFVVLLSLRRLLDVLAVGDEEADSLGVRASRIRLLVVLAATFGTAAVVAVSGLIGFVGIVVPHAIRLVVGTSYRRILPLSVLYGAAFLVVCDVVARSVLAPAEVPIGVVTAAVGAPFFLVVLRRSGRLS
jgi:iron complex transport system permease protein